jgi:hypothetical protein
VERKFVNSTINGQSETFTKKFPRPDLLKRRRKLDQYLLTLKAPQHADREGLLPLQPPRTHDLFFSRFNQSLGRSEAELSLLISSKAEGNPWFIVGHWPSSQMKESLYQSLTLICPAVVAGGIILAAFHLGG